MKILALDTSMTACSVACVLVDDISGEIGMLAEIRKDMARGHAEALVPMIARVMDEAGTGFDSLDRVAVTIGPGSFTGLRVGIATARGLGLALDIPVAGIGTLDALATDFVASRDGLKTPFAILLDARREQIYVRNYDADGLPRDEAVVCDLEDMSWLGNPSTLLAGPGAAVLAERGLLNVAHGDIMQLPHQNGPTARSIAALGAKADDLDSRPAPLYLRPADAKAQDHKSLARQ